MDGVRVIRYAYAPRAWETLIYGGGIVPNLRRSPWKLLLLPTLFLVAASRLRKMLKCGVDVVHAHWIIPSGVAAALVSRRVPFMVTAHGSDVFGLRGNLMERLRAYVLRRATHVTTVSPPLADRLRDAGLDSSRLTILPMGTDLGTFSPDADLRRDRFHVLFVGRLIPIKGCDVLLRAIAMLAEDYPGLRLSIVGDGSGKAGLVQLAASLGIASRVHFLGSLDHDRLSSLYRSVSMLAWPSVRLPNGQQEGLGMVVAEAAACGCPVVASDQPAMRWLMEGADKVLFRQGSPDDLARIIAERFDDPGQFDAFDHVVGQRVRERLDWNVVGRRYGALLERARHATDENAVS